MDETLRKATATKSTTDETKVPEQFDVNKTSTKVFYFFFAFFLSHQKLRNVYLLWNEYSI